MRGPVGVTVLTIADTSPETFSGSITDSFASLAGNWTSIRLVKSGTGTLTLGGDDSYSGGTELDEGTLVLGNYAALPGWDGSSWWSTAGGST